MGGLCATLNLLLLGVEPPELAPTGFGMALLKMVGALVLVCVLAYVALRLARRHLMATRPGSLLRVVERCPLSARQSVWIVEAAGRYFLLGGSEGNVTRLAELDPQQVAALAAAPAPRFRDVLARRGSGEAKPREDS